MVNWHISRSAVVDYVFAFALLFGPPTGVLVGVMIFIAYHFKHLRMFDAELFLIVFFWLVFSVGWHSQAGYDLNLAEFAQVLFGVLVFHIVARRSRGEGEATAIRTRFIHVGLVFAAVEVAVQAVDINYGAVLGTPANNVAAQFALLFLMIPAFDKSTGVLQRLLLLVAGGAVAFVNESRAVMAVIGIVFAMQATSFRPILKIILCIVGAIGAMYVVYSGLAEQVLTKLLDVRDNFSNLERLKLWQFGWDHFLNHPLGSGIGSSLSYTSYNGFSQGDTYPHVHNTALFMMMELGFIGAALYVYIFGRAVIRSLHIRACGGGATDLTVAVVLILLGLIDALFYNGALSLLIWLQLGLIKGKSAYFGKMPKPRRSAAL